MKFLIGTSAHGLFIVLLLFIGSCILKYMQELVVGKVRRYTMTKILLYKVVNSSFIAMLESTGAALKSPSF
jgi:hypothetical protein